MFWTRLPEPPDPAALTLRKVLLASEGRRFPADAVAFAAGLAAPRSVPVHVLSIARVWGTAFGFPNPNLYPSRQEWDQQRDLVAEAVRALEQQGIKATGQVIGTRNATRRIVEAARRTACATGPLPTSTGRRNPIAFVGGPSCRSTWSWRAALPWLEVPLTDSPWTKSRPSSADSLLSIT
jgi:hypothetical protein